VSALDRVQSADILARVRTRHQTMIIALHDIALALGHADRIVVLEAGRIVLDAPARDLSAADLVPYYGG
jgi:phosphonate transport system ATP-binding protein